MNSTTNQRRTVFTPPSPGRLPQQHDDIVEPAEVGERLDLELLGQPLGALVDLHHPPDGDVGRKDAALDPAGEDQVLAVSTVDVGPDVDDVERLPLPLP